MAEALIGTGIPFIGRGDHPRFLTTLNAVMAATSGVRRLGAASLDLAYVAAGRFEGFWEFGLQPWDHRRRHPHRPRGRRLCQRSRRRPGMLASGDVVAANDHLHPPLLELLKKALQEPAAN